MKLSLSLILVGFFLTSGSLTMGEEAKTDMKESAESTAYHAEWGPSRGFKPGETLPDIPLMDLEGNEVRFDQFLGKRYILYGWASW